MGFVEKAPGKVVNETKDFVRLAFAAGRHLRLLAFGRPRGAQRAPLGNTGLLAKEQQGLALLGLAEHLGPSGVTPLEAFGFIEVIGDKTSFLVRNTTWKVSCNPLNFRKQFAEGFFRAVFIS